MSLPKNMAEKKLLIFYFLILLCLLALTFCFVRPPKQKVLPWKLNLLPYMYVCEILKNVILLIKFINHLF